MTGSWIDPYYSTGQFDSESDGFRDASYKIVELQKLLDSSRQFPSLFPLSRVADVGCGSGHTTFLLQAMCSQNGYGNGDVYVEGYDVHPAVLTYQNGTNIKFVHGDFCTLDMPLFDLTILFDVIEHVPAPVEFLRQVAFRSRFVALHIPLDDSVFSWYRQLPLKNLRNPGHLLILDSPAALNIVAMAGLRTMLFRYSPVFQAPSGSISRVQKLLNPLRVLLYYFNPYLLQKTLGGISLMVLAASPKAWKKIP
jgi:SAM-dependent methyltransferase